MAVFIQRDAPLDVLDVLQAASFLDGVKVTTNTNHKQSIHDGPYVIVASDGTPSGGRVTATEIVRVAVFSKWRPEARSLAAWIEAYLLDPAYVTGFAPNPGNNLFITDDPTTGGFVASVGVRLAGTKIGVK